VEENQSTKFAVDDATKQDWSKKHGEINKG
jgi:hypothetical protein